MKVSSRGLTMHFSWQQIGKYALIRRLGRGGFADVYLGEHIYLHTQVAIKIMRSLDEFDVDTFQTEAQFVAQLRHPHIIRVLDFDLEGETPFLVMDYAPNGTIRQLYPEGTRLEPHVVLEYVEQVADALHYIHGQHLIHRDVKPENLLLGADGEVLLSDFGISIAAHRTVVRTATVVGTVPYMAPEQFQGHPCVASDQYALAVMVYEWLCGDRPFRGTPRAIMRQRRSEPPPSLCARVPGLPLAVEQVVLRGLAENPRQRFESAQDFAYALREAFEEQDITMENESFPVQPARPYPVRADRSGSGPALWGQQQKHHSMREMQNQQKKTGRRKRKDWQGIAICYAIDLLLAIILSSALSALNIPPTLLQWLLIFCIVLLPLVWAVVRRNKRLGWLTLSIATLAAALAFSLHALIVFIAAFLALQLVSLWVAFAVSVKRSTH